MNVKLPCEHENSLEIPCTMMLISPISQILTFLLPFWMFILALGQTALWTWELLGICMHHDVTVTGMFPIPKSQMSMMLTFVWPSWIFILALGQQSVLHDKSSEIACIMLFISCRQRGSDLFWLKRCLFQLFAPYTNIFSLSSPNDTQPAL